MEHQADVLLAVRVQVLHIAELARGVRPEAEDGGRALVDAIDAIARRAEVCRQVIDGQLEPRAVDEAPTPRTTAVAPVVHEAVREVGQRGLCDPDGIRVLVDDDALVLAGRETLLHILTGLLADACQHARPGTPVAIAARDDVVEAHIEVTHDSDRGDRDRFDVLLGEPEASDDAFAAGIALNLRLVRALVESHGGYLEVEPEGAQLTVTVCLPSAPPRRLPPDVIDIRERSRARRDDPRIGGGA